LVDFEAPPPVPVAMADCGMAALPLDVSTELNDALAPMAAEEAEVGVVAELRELEFTDAL
jgi:hypothetical protein